MNTAQAVRDDLTGAATVDQPLEMSPFQERVMLIPEDVSVFLGGGRGGGKSVCIAQLVLQHSIKYGSNARILYLRKTYKGLADFEQITLDLFGRIYGKSAKYNFSEHVWRLPSGAYFELGQYETVGDYSKYQGRSFTLLIIDEAGQYADPAMLDKLRSNLRGPVGVPIRQVIAANPGDVGHHWLAKRYALRTPWAMFEHDGDSWWVNAPSTYLENPHIDADAYRRQLEASCPADPELLECWLSGSWAVVRGSFFASVLDDKANGLDPQVWSPPLKLKRGRTRVGNSLWLEKSEDPWEFYISMDWGTAAPAVVYLCAESPGGYGPDERWYPRGSVLLLDEVSTHQPNNLAVGMGYTVPHVAELVKGMTARWKVKPRGVCDDACFAKTGISVGSTIASEFAKEGVYFVPARKRDRATGWQIMRVMLQNAASGKVDKPGLRVSRACRGWWETVPVLGRDPRRAEDVDSQGLDHWADATRYAILRRRGGTTSTEFGV